MMKKTSICSKQDLKQDSVHWLADSLEIRTGCKAGFLKASLDIEKIQQMLEEKGIYSIADLPDDGFMAALGVDPEKYRDPLDPTGYDWLRALSDTAAADWADYGKTESTAP